MTRHADDVLTINQAAETTGWSPRMLRYIERIGLVAPERSTSGYRIYGAGELQRLRTLRELLRDFEIELSEVGFAARLNSDSRLRESVNRWLAARVQRPEQVTPAAWLAYEQAKHERLLTSIACESTPADSIEHPQTSIQEAA